MYLTVRLKELQTETRMATQMGTMMAHLTEMQRVKLTEMSSDQLMEVLLATSLVLQTDVGSETTMDTPMEMHLD